MHKKNYVIEKIDGKETIKVFCDLCGKKARLRRKRDKMIWYCAPCDASVGVNSNSPLNKPLGSLADKELRYWRIMAHQAFDPLWQIKKHRRHIKVNNRNEAYRWVSGYLLLKQHESHIAMLSLEQCKKMVKVCNLAQEGKTHLQIVEVMRQSPASA